MALLPIPKNSPSIGECIYCGLRDVDLSREHAVPYGLNGPWTLLRASCSTCSGITHRFEGDALRGLLPSIRAVLDLQTRRPKKRPLTFPLVVESKGVQRTIQVPVAKFPGYLPTPMFPPPGVVVGRSCDEAPDVHLDFRHVRGPTFEQFAKDFPGADFVGARVRFLPEMYARMIAKIAYCAAIYAIGVFPLRHSPIRRVILGQDRHVFHWVGSWAGDPVNDEGSLHNMQLRSSGSDLHVILRLFAQFGAPEYHVALGAADEGFVQSPEWPWQ